MPVVAAGGLLLAAGAACRSSGLAMPRWVVDGLVLQERCYVQTPVAVQVLHNSVVGDVWPVDGMAGVALLYFSLKSIC